MITDKYNSLFLSTITWYGMPVRIHVSNTNLHRVALPWLGIPHFGLVNLIARQGMPEELRLELTAQHELGHLQTLPFVLIHLIISIMSVIRNPRKTWLLRLLTHSAISELFAEIYTITVDQRTLKAKRPFHQALLYYGFWANMLAISIVGTKFLMRDQRNNS